MEQLREHLKMVVLPLFGGTERPIAAPAMPPQMRFTRSENFPTPYFFVCRLALRSVPIIC
jgi:hypothetical protein